MPLKTNKCCCCQCTTKANHECCECLPNTVIVQACHSEGLGTGTGTVDNTPCIQCDEVSISIDFDTGVPRYSFRFPNDLTLSDFILGELNDTYADRIRGEIVLGESVYGGCAWILNIYSLDETEIIYTEEATYFSCDVIELTFEGVPLSSSDSGCTADLKISSPEFLASSRCISPQTGSGECQKCLCVWRYLCVNVFFVGRYEEPISTRHRYGEWGPLLVEWDNEIQGWSWQFQDGLTGIDYTATVTLVSDEFSGVSRVVTLEDNYGQLGEPQEFTVSCEADHFSGSETFPQRSSDGSTGLPSVTVGFNTNTSPFECQLGCETPDFRLTSILSKVETQEELFTGSGTPPESCIDGGGDLAIGIDPAVLRLNCVATFGNPPLEIFPRDHQILSSEEYLLEVFMRYNDQAGTTGDVCFYELLGTYSNCTDTGELIASFEIPLPDWCCNFVSINDCDPQEETVLVTYERISGTLLPN